MVDVVVVGPFFCRRRRRAATWQGKFFCVCAPPPTTNELQQRERPFECEKEEARKLFFLSFPSAGVSPHSPADEKRRGIRKNSLFFQPWGRPRLKSFSFPLPREANRDFCRIKRRRHAEWEKRGSVSFLLPSPPFPGVSSTFLTAGSDQEYRGGARKEKSGGG